MCRVHVSVGIFKCWADGLIEECFDVVFERVRQIIKRETVIPMLCKV